MGLVELLIPKRKREAVEKTLEDEDIAFTLVEEESRDEPLVVITFPLWHPRSNQSWTTSETRESTRIPTP